MENERRRSATTTVLGAVAGVGISGALVAALPWFVGASWPAIGSSLAAVSPLVMLGLVALWFLGLLVHAPVLMAAMPGLRAGQALTLNMSGSAVSNLLPLGGPAGMGLGYAMARSWGFGSEEFAAYTVSTNLVNTICKFSFSMLILAGAVAAGVAMPPGLGLTVVLAAGFTSMTVVVLMAAFRTERSTETTGRRLDGVARRIRPTLAPAACSTWLVSTRRELVSSVSGGWGRMVGGVLTYVALQGMLLWACLAAVGAGATLGAVAVAFAIERLISLAPITPGAAGITELGTIAALHSFGIHPVAATAGVLLYRILMFAVDMPVGGLLALRWLHGQRTSAPAVAPVAVPRFESPVVLEPAA